MPKGPQKDLHHQGSLDHKQSEPELRHMSGNTSLSSSNILLFTGQGGSSDQLPHVCPLAIPENTVFSSRSSVLVSHLILRTVGISSSHKIQIQSDSLTEASHFSVNLTNCPTFTPFSYFQHSSTQAGTIFLVSQMPNTKSGMQTELSKHLFNVL